MFPNSLASALLTRFEQHGASTDLDSARKRPEEALVCCPEGRHGRAIVLLLNKLAIALLL
jgi:hypothetical protein